jgi:HK97 family phage portal protein
MRWPWSRRPAVDDAGEAALSAIEPAPAAAVEPHNNVALPESIVAAMLAAGGGNYSGVHVDESTALGLSAVYRAVSLISGTIAQLPLRTLRERAGRLDRVPSVFDDPQGAVNGLTRFEWVETILIHLLLHGNAYLLHVYNGAGALLALMPQHPLCVEVYWPRPEDERWPVGNRWYRVTDIWGRQTIHDATTLTHISAQNLDGLKGLSPLTIARNSLGTAVGGERSAARLFSQGAMISGMAVPDDDLEDEELKTAKAELNRHLLGWENAGRIAVVNRKLNFTPWTMSAADAQFIQSRQFSIEEVARWFGVPPHLLMQTEKQTSWGQGVNEQNRGLGKFTLSPWTSRVEQRLSRLLPPQRWCEFDFAGLERPNVETEIDLILKQVEGGLITPNEGRALRNLAPLPGGDVLRVGPATAPEPTEEPADALAA